MAEDIIQRVILSGQNEVISAFSSMGSAGKTAFEAIESLAGGGIIGAFEKIGAAIVGVGVALFAWSEKAAEATVAIGRLASELGTSVEDMSALRGALVAGGADADTFALAFKRLAIRIETDWPQIVKNVAESADKSRESSLKISEANQRLIDDQEKLGDSYTKSAQAAIDAQLGIRGATLSLESAELRLQGLFSSTGKVNPELAKMLAIKEAQLAVDKAQQEVIKANQKVIDDQIKEDIAERDLQNKIIQDRINKSKELQKAQEEELKDIGSIARALDGQNKSMDLNKVAAADLLKGIELLAAGMNTAVKPTGIQVFFAMADAMKNATTASEKLAISQLAFGRGASQAMIDAMKGGSEELKKFQEAFKAANLEITQSDLAKGTRLHEAFNNFKNDVAAVVEILGDKMAPVFSFVIEKLDEFLRFISSGKIFASLTQGFADFLTWFKESWIGKILLWLDDVIQKLNKLGQALGGAKSSFDDAGKSGGNTSGFAVGGPVYGQGSGTSDSIPAWLSHGEFVVRADGSNLWDAFAHYVTQGFASGGLVPAPIGTGGISSATHTLNLTIDGQSFTGLKAPEDTAQRLARFAISRQLSSAGRKPSWMK